MAPTGANGMPLIGTGDWTDGMNRVGKGGAGTSVWLGWLLITTIGMMAPLADRHDPARAGVEGGLLGLNRAGQVLTPLPPVSRATGPACRHRSVSGTAASTVSSTIPPRSEQAAPG